MECLRSLKIRMIKYGENYMYVRSRKHLVMGTIDTYDGCRAGGGEYSEAERG